MAKKEKERKDELVDLVRDITKYDERQQKIHTIAQLINDFIQGDQWKTYVSETGMVRDIPIPSGQRKKKDRVTANFIFPIWRTYKSLILRSTPKVQPEPENPKDIYDMMGTEMAHRVVNYITKKLLMKRKRSRIANILLDYGGIVMLPFIKEGERGNELDSALFPPTQFFPYPSSADSWEQVIGGTYQRMVPIEVMERLYPEEEFKPTETPQHLRNIKERGEEVKNMVLVNDYYERPMGDNKGCYVRIANDKVIEGDSNKFPFKHGRLPFILINENDLSDGLFGFPSLKLILNRQIDHNKAQSLLMELWKCLPKLLVRQDSKINPKDMVDVMTTVLEYMGEGGAPQWTAPPHPSTALLEASRTIPNESEHTIGLSRITLYGEPTGSLQSNVALQTLQEQDLNRVYTLIDNMKIGYEEFYTQGYELIRQYYSTSDIMAMLGDKGKLQYKAFKSIKLSPMTFTIEADSLYPKNPTIEQERAAQAAQYGAINMADRRERREFLKIQLPGMAEAFSNDVRQENIQREENVKMLDGKTVKPKPYHDHEIHLDVINEIINDLSFENLDEKIQANFLAHQGVHAKAVDEKIKKMMQMQMQLQGKVQEPGQLTIEPATEGGAGGV